MCPLSIPGAVFFIICTWLITSAHASDSLQWQQVETKYTVLRFLSKDDLVRFEQKIKYGERALDLRGFFRPKDADDLLERVTQNVDKLWERVMEILDMRKKTPKVTVQIYGSKAQLAGAYYDIYKKESPFRAWYIYEFNTIYVNVNDLNEGMLAHEMAHAVIDHYLQVRPPAASAEILARYVDDHLKD